MKIGLLTLPFTWNYGGILQAFALQKILHNLGHEVIIISRRRNRNNLLLRGMVWAKWTLMKTLRVFNFFHFVPLVAVEEFKKQYFQDITPNIFSDNSMRRTVNKFKFKGYIVGSDQVWNYGSPPHLYNYFLDFTENSDVVRLAYSASFGREGWHYTKQETLVCSELAQKFDAISVREVSGVDLCKKYLKVQVDHHLDPTMLLDKDYYIKIINSSKVSQSNGKLLLYILDFSEENQKIVSEVKNILKLKPFAVRQDKKTKLIKNALKGIYPSVAQWLKSFYDAEFVITDSFHGTIFSIIFNKPFIAIANKKRGLARFNSLLQMLELENFLVSSSLDISEKKIKSIIDWKDVNKKIEIHKSIAIQYLERNFK